MRPFRLSINISFYNHFPRKNCHPKIIFLEKKGLLEKKELDYLTLDSKVCIWLFHVLLYTIDRILFISIYLHEKKNNYMKRKHQLTKHQYLI